MSDFERHAFFCRCFSPEHQFIFSFDPDALECKECYLTVHLTKPRFFARIWRGIKYIFGYTSKYGDWDEIVLSKEDVTKLINLFYGCLELGESGE